MYLVKSTNQVDSAISLNVEQLILPLRLRSLLDAHRKRQRHRIPILGILAQLQLISSFQIVFLNSYEWIQVLSLYFTVLARNIRWTAWRILPMSQNKYFQWRQSFFCLHLTTSHWFTWVWRTRRHLMCLLRVVYVVSQQSTRVLYRKQVKRIYMRRESLVANVYSVCSFKLNIVIVGPPFSYCWRSCDNMSAVKTRACW